ncbi:MAG: YggT family protein [Deltaproteobacteria bacterium]|jgi:YggT family protein|nr:YggT family protein [Deltaproteobacteria bacterium]
MIFVYNALLGLAQILSGLISIFIILFIVRAVISWFSPDPYNPLVRFINSCTDPILVKIRSKVPTIGMLDFSVIIVILLLYFIQTALIQSMVEYTTMSKNKYLGQMIVLPDVLK